MFHSNHWNSTVEEVKKQHPATWNAALARQACCCAIRSAHGVRENRPQASFSPFWETWLDGKCTM